MAGLFCGSSGYLCAIAGGSNPEGSGDEEGSGDVMARDQSRMFDMEEDMSKYPQLNLEHLE